MFKEAFGVVLLIIIFALGGVLQNKDDYFNQRYNMIKILKEEGIKDNLVLEAMLKVPRHLFVPDEVKHLAYRNIPLPIWNYQTISQPSIVALMTEAARINKDSKVLEIGTGSGYQAAILAEICKEVYTIEIIENLALKSKKILGKLNYTHLYQKIGNGNRGWPEQAPFNAIIITAALKKLPSNLINQLAIGGYMIVPIEEKLGEQYLMRISKTLDNKLVLEKLKDVIFVPFLNE